MNANNRKQHFKQTYWVLLCLSLIPFHSWAGALLIGSTDQQRPLGNHVLYLSDDQLTIDEVVQLPLERWQKQSTGNVNFGFNTSPHWFRLHLANTSSNRRQLLLELANPNLNRIDFYHYQDNRLLKASATGDAFPFAQRPVEHRNFLFPLTIASDTEHVFYFRVETGGSLELPITLWDKDHFYAHDQSSLALETLYYGAMLVMLAYNLFLFLATRDRAYLYYVAFVASFIIFLASLHGYAYQFLWPNLTSWNSWAIPWGIAGILISGSFFTREFLELASRQIWLDRCFIAIAIVAGALLCSGLILDYAWVVRSLVSIIVPCCALAIFAGIDIWNKNQRIAQFYSIAWLALLSGGILLTLNKLGIIPTSNISQYSIQVGSIAEVILLSFALAERINTHKQNKYQAQQWSIQQEQLAQQEKERALKMRLRAKEETVKAEQAQAESQAKSEFIAKISHAIRNPLNGIMGMAELLDDSNLATKQQRYVNVIYRSGQELLNLVNDVVDLSKLEAGNITVEAIEFDLQDLIADQVGTAALSLQHKPIDVVADIEPGTPERWQGDPTHLRQILSNLLANAVQFTDSGEIVVRIKYAQNNGSGLQIVVIDTGIGIDPQQQDHLLDQHNQLRSTQTYGEGHIGLSLCKELIQLMKGSFDIQSRPGHGTHISFALPFAPIPATPGEPLSDTKAMLLCDHLSQADAIINALAPLGIKVTVLTKKSSETNIYIDDKPNLLLVDDSCAGWKGLHLLEQLDDWHAVPRLNLWFDTSVAPSHGITICKPLLPRQLYQGLNQILPIKQHLSAHAWWGTPNGCQVLVAEDIEVNRLVLEGQLHKLGVKSLVVRHGHEALDHYCAAPDQFDLLLLDTDLPEHDSRSTAEQIRQFEQHHQLEPIPIIALSGNTDEGSHGDFSASAMNAWLCKPVRLETLRTTLSRYLQ